MWNRAELLCLRARAALDLGELDAAEQFIQRALEAKRDEDITGTAEVLDQYGLILAARGKLDQAESTLRQALDVVAGSDYFWVRSIAAIDLAHLLATRGKLVEAQGLTDEYSKVARERDWHLFDARLAVVAGLSGRT